MIRFRLSYPSVSSTSVSRAVAKSLPILATGFLFTGPAVAGIVKPAGVTSSIAGDATSNVSFLLNDNPAFAPLGLQDADGLAATLETGDPLSKAANTYAYRAADGQTESWTANKTSGNPVFVFDLSGGGDTAVGSVVLWQYGNFGADDTPVNNGNDAREFSVIFHTEAEGNVFNFGTETAELTGAMSPLASDTPLGNGGQIFFSGTTHQARYAALRINSNYQGQPGITAGGSRYGLGEVRFATEAVQDPALVPPPNFTGTSSGAPVTITLPITNNGVSANLNITAATLEGDSAGSYTITSALPLQVAPGATKNLTLKFDPAGATGTFNATLMLETNDLAHPQYKVTMSVAASVPKISVTPPGDFGPLANGGAPQTFTVPVANTGSGALTLYDASFPSVDTAPGLTEHFTFPQDPVNGGALTIPPGGTVNLAFQFDPAGLIGGVYYTVLRISSDDPDKSTADVTVRVNVTPSTTAAPLVAWWPLDSDSLDASGNGHDGSETGSVIYNVTGANAATGQAAEFDGASGIHVPFDDALNPTSYTLTAWASPDTNTGNGSVVTNRNDSLVTDGFNYGFILYRIDAQWQFWTGRGTPFAGNWDSTVTAPVTVNNWVHLAVVYDNAAHTKTLYVDGAAVSTVPDSVVERNLLENLHIGSGLDAGNGVYFDGKIDDVALFRTALDAAAINTIRTSGVAGYLGLTPPVVEPFAITGVKLTGGNIVISGATGLTAGQQYHLQTGVDLTDFKAVAGSTFLGGDPIPSVPAAGPRRFVRIASGPVPP